MSHPSAAPGPAPGSGGPKLLTRLRSAVRARHYSARTEESYVGWVKRFVRFHGKRHPATLGEALEGLREDSLVRETLGDSIYEGFLDAKSIEWSEYRRQVHTWEIERYLPVF